MWVYKGKVKNTIRIKSILKILLTDMVPGLKLLAIVVEIHKGKEVTVPAYQSADF